MSDRRRGYHPDVGEPKVPTTAYVLLWFPKPSETFVFSEVAGLRRLGAAVHVFSLYGPWRRDLSREMRAYDGPVERLGVAAIPRVVKAAVGWWRRQPAVLARLTGAVLRWQGASPEAYAEALWGWLCGPWLASRCQAHGIEHIHAPWARGAATAAWVAGRLASVPFSFTARSHDLFRPDGHLAAKARAARFVRTDVGRYVEPLVALAGDEAPKVRLLRTGMPLSGCARAPVPMRPPYKLLAIGRVVPKKGFPVLLRACRILLDRGVDFHLTLAGGAAGSLRRLAGALDLGERVRFPGFITHDRVGELYREADIFVVPSVVSADGDRDGVPNVLIEALGHRLPVVASDVGGIAEVVEDGVTGRLVPSADPVRLAAGIQTTLRDREAALRLAERGLALVQREYHADSCHGRLLELFRDATP